MDETQGQTVNTSTVVPAVNITTTTTTEVPTTTSTTVAPSGDQVAGSQEAQLNSATTNSTTVTSGAATAPVVEKRGEVLVDNGANAKVLQEQSAEERISDAQTQALDNHDREHAGADQDRETEVSRDKVA